jgi:hypothetical protein
MESDHGGRSSAATTRRPCASVVTWTTRMCGRGWVLRGHSLRVMRRVCTHRLSRRGTKRRRPVPTATAVMR